MNKQDLIFEMCKNNGLSKTESKRVVGLFFQRLNKPSSDGSRQKRTRIASRPGNIG
jgi:nucleoid DNA-binding protein